MRHVSYLPGQVMSEKGVCLQFANCAGSLHGGIEPTVIFKSWLSLRDMYQVHQVHKSVGKMRRSDCCLPLTLYTKKNTHAQRTVDLPERSIGWRSGRHVFVLVGSNPTVDIYFFVVFGLIFSPLSSSRQPCPQLPKVATSCQLTPTFICSFVITPTSFDRILVSRISNHVSKDHD